MQNTTPTTEQFAAYEAMANYFNEKLFAGALPPVLLNFSRKSRAYGFFSPERWKKGEEVRHEISLNPDHIEGRPAKETASTLVHELVHLWQQEFGKPSRSGYHNREWAEKMQEVGLMPSSTGGPGGQMTGQRVSHWIVEGGRFDRAFNAMPEEFLLPWVALVETKTEKKVTRYKYACEGCGAQAWGKQGLRLACRDCDSDLDEIPVGEEAAR